MITPASGKADKKEEPKQGPPDGVNESVWIEPNDSAGAGNDPTLGANQPQAAMPSTGREGKTRWHDLWVHFLEEHDLTLTEPELNKIIQLVNEWRADYGSLPDLYDWHVIPDIDERNYGSLRTVENTTICTCPTWMAQALERAHNEALRASLIRLASTPPQASEEQKQSVSLTPQTATPIETKQKASPAAPPARGDGERGD